MQLRNLNPLFAGAILVGHFPQATIVRRWLWETGYTTPVVNPSAPQGQLYVQCWPEPVADWSDIVLGDLTGNWDALYREAVNLAAFKGIASEGSGLAHGERRTFKPGNFLKPGLRFSDVFIILEDAFSPTFLADGSAEVTLDMTRRDPEVFEPLAVQRNPLAMPDIAISRIDARGASLSASSLRADSQGRHWVDGNGLPQTVDVGIGSDPLRSLSQLIPDEQLERMLLLSYLERNHRHRTNPTVVPNRVAAFSSWDFSNTALWHADALSSPAAAGAPEPPIAVQGGNLADYARFWDTPASIRAIHAHSSSTMSAFPVYVPGSKPPAAIPNFASAALNALLPTFYRWHAVGALPNRTYVPGADEQEDHADFWLHRSLWMNRKISQGGSFVVHYGCNSPNAIWHLAPIYTVGLRPGTARHVHTFLYRRARTIRSHEGVLRHAPRFPQARE